MEQELKAPADTVLNPALKHQTQKKDSSLKLESSL